MSGLLERVRAALADEYDVERELGGGGMGVVFLGRDRALDCPVAIKVLRMELATAVAAERFIREAQLLARVRHPAVVTVHRALSRDGLYFMIMELLEGTLADRLSTRQPIPADEVIQFGAQLLDGLAQVHARGIVHRDIKPSNIFIREDGGPKLGDFGIARRVDAGEDGLTGTGQIVGTPRYMSPEQLVSSEVTSTSDVYSVGMVLYEMVSGRRWELEDPARGRWDGVPRRLARVLRRALTLEPDLRWSDARAFAAVLRKLHGRHRQLRAVGAGAGVVAFLAITIAALIVLLRPPVPPTGIDRSDIALVFTVDGGGPDLGRTLAYYTRLQLESAFGDSGLRVMPPAQSMEWAALVGTDALSAGSWDTLQTNAILRAGATVSAGSVVVEGKVLQRDGTVRRLSRHVTGNVNDLGDVGCKVATAVVQAVRPADRSAFRCLQQGKVAEAIGALIAGNVAFDRDNWTAAEAQYKKALQLDSSMARAVWGLYNVCRWGRYCDTTSARASLRRTYEQYPKQFGDLEQLLIEADLAPTVPERLAIYDTAIKRFGYDADPKLLLGNELFHRGALAGTALDSAITMFNAVVRDNPKLSPAYEMLAWAEIRRGHRAQAESALGRYRELAASEQEQGLSFRAVLGQAMAERFGSDREIQIGRDELSASPDGFSSVAKMLRLALALGIPNAQLHFGRLVATSTDAAGQGLIGQSVALLALGRIREAFEQFDAAARISNGDPEMELQALEWSLGLSALGLPGVPAKRREAARSRLAALTKGPRGARASWILLLDALERGDVTNADTMAMRVRTGDPAGFLSRLSDAFLSANAGDTSEALRLTDSLRLWVDSHHHIADPLVRVALFLNRGRWLEEHDAAGADRAWRWYENADWAGDWLRGPPKPAEMDWAFETYARYLRAQLAHAHGDTARVCAVGVDAAERWQNADSAYKPLRDSLLAWTSGCGPS